MNCGNCKTRITCGCQKRTASDGKQVCSKCVNTYEASLKKKKYNNMIGGRHIIFKSRIKGLDVDLLNDTVDDTGFINEHYFDGSYMGQYLYRLTVCCKAGDPYYVEVLVPAPLTGSNYRYIATSDYTDPSGNILKQYDFFSVSQILTPSGADPTPISNVAFELIDGVICKTCPDGQATFERRCDGSIITLNIQVADFAVQTDPEAFYKYTGSIVLIDANGTPVYPDDYLHLISKSTTTSSTSDQLLISDTEEALCAEIDPDCGICPTYYKLVACDESVTEEYCTNEDLSAYVGSGALKVTINNEPSDICWTVEESTSCAFLSDIVINEEFSDCVECATPLIYRLESCDTDGDSVIYSRGGLYK